MKRLISILIISLLIPLIGYSSYNYELGYLKVMGYVSHVCELTTETYTQYLPFNMKGDEVQPTTNLSTYAGLGIGEWTLFSDYASVEIGIKATPFELDGAQIPYYIQFSYPNSSSYDSTYSLLPIYSDNVEVVKNLDYLLDDGYIVVSSAKIYVKMALTADELESSGYPEGRYSSTITMRVTAND